MIRVVLAAVLTLLLEENAIAGDTATSELQRCKICHSLERGGPNRVGPNLFGVFGRHAGTMPGYSYSPAMKRSDIVWDDATMSAFLRDPRGAIPGNHMSFPGVEDEAVLADLLARLKQATQ